MYGGSDCPPTTSLMMASGTIHWQSNPQFQGNWVDTGGHQRSNDCGVTETCGLKPSRHGAGGGWELCFAAPRSCVAAHLSNRTAEITSECCDEPDEDCTGGYPHRCNSGCAKVVLQFWADCSSELSREAAQDFIKAVEICVAGEPEPEPEP
jgi:hypothetical protein